MSYTGVCLARSAPGADLWLVSRGGESPSCHSRGSAGAIPIAVGRLVAAG